MNMKRFVILITFCLVGIFSLAQDISLLQLRAEQGDASAQFALCGCYITGHGVEADNSMALGYLIQAAENDYPEALYELGCCYKDGALGLPVWEEKAKEYLFRALELGYSNAEDILDDMTDDYEKQAKRIRRAVYKHIMLVAPQSQQSKYRDNRRRFIRQ